LQSVWSCGFSQAEAVSPGRSKWFESPSRDSILPAKARTPYTAPSRKASVVACNLPDLGIGFNVQARSAGSCGFEPFLVSRLQPGRGLLTFMPVICLDETVSHAGSGWNNNKQEKESPLRLRLLTR
jgi:hypothetical protein